MKTVLIAVAATLVLVGGLFFAPKLALRENGVVLGQEQINRIVPQASTSQTVGSRPGCCPPLGGTPPANLPPQDGIYGDNKSPSPWGQEVPGSGFSCH